MREPGPATGAGADVRDAGADVRGAGADVRGAGADVRGAAADITARARRVRLLTCDVDGVLTDGRIYVDDQGRELKAFSALDGVAMHRLASAGIVVAWITGSAAAAVTHRAQQLRIPHLVLDAQDKLVPWERLRSELGLAAEACAHIGDDLADIPVLAACGFGVTVPHAPSAVRANAHYVTARDGGHGAVREIADMILAAQGHDPAHGVAQALAAAAAASPTADRETS